MKIIKNYRKRVLLTALGLFTVLIFFQNCEKPKAPGENPGAQSSPQMSGNGSGYTGIRPKPGNYIAKLETKNCIKPAESYLEKITVRDDSTTVLVENECDQTSKEVPLVELNVQTYRQDHVTRDGKIYEHEMKREVEYYNEALCDFSDKGFGILIRWYNAYLFHVAHIFSTEHKDISPLPLIRYSDWDWGNGNYGTGYQGTNFELAVLNNYKLSENGLAGYFQGNIGPNRVEALGICITTTYQCEPAFLKIVPQSIPEEFKIQSDTSVEGVDAGSIVLGSLKFTGDLGDLILTVQHLGGQTYDCRGYVSRLNNELTVGGCKNRVADNGEPKNVNVQVRGKIQWSGAGSTLTGTVASKVCYDKSLTKP